MSGAAVGADTSKIYEAMKEHLSQGELPELCAYLNAADPGLDLDLGNLPAPKNQAILELIAHSRHRRSSVRDW
jgi:hypothetical protein